jgi:hypothetical protein
MSCGSIIYGQNPEIKELIYGVSGRAISGELAADAHSDDLPSCELCARSDVTKPCGFRKTEVAQEEKPLPKQGLD